MSAPPWYQSAKRHVGVSEVPGLKHEPLILAWWRAIKRGGIRDDETPWCAAFVGAMLEESGIVSSRFESARSYLTWGTPLQVPVEGCIVVLRRVGGGHVGFVAGVEADGRILVLGGNQTNKVSIAAFARDRVVRYLWPPGLALPPVVALPRLSAQASVSEA